MTWPAADLADRLADLTARGLPFLVAELSGAATGFAYAAPRRAKPAHRHSVEDGVRRIITVIAHTGDEAPRALHRRTGFTDAGRLVSGLHDLE